MATAVASTEKNEFLLPDQGTHDGKVVITAIVDVENCENAPWKLQKKIHYNTATAPAAAPGAPAAGAPAAGTAGASVKVPTPKPISRKLPKPITQQLPNTGPPPQRRAWLTPIDSGARLDQKLQAPVLSRLDQKTDEANSTNALIGLGIIGGLFAISTVGGFIAFRRRDEVQFEAAMTEQLKHLEEGDPGYEFGGDLDEGPPIVAEEAPFAEGVAPPAEVLGEPIAAEPARPSRRRASRRRASRRRPSSPKPSRLRPRRIRPSFPPPRRGRASRDRADRGTGRRERRVSGGAGARQASRASTGQRSRPSSGGSSTKPGSRQSSRTSSATPGREAERHGIALDADLMVQALCEEINGSAKLSDPKRAELRNMFAEIIAEESHHVSAEAQHVPAEGEKISTP